MAHSVTMRLPRISPTPLAYKDYIIPPGVSHLDAMELLRSNTSRSDTGQPVGLLHAYGPDPFP